jgi:hypothetical protein
MIRDPSDGSVREEITPDANKINDLIRDSVPKGISPDTGIRQPTRSDAQERLERSREWLKNYHASKHGENSDDLVCRDHESELPPQSGERAG